MSGDQVSDPYLAKRRRAESENRVQSPAGAFYDKRYLLKIIDELTAENARLNVEMLAYREKLTPADAQAMAAVIKALYEAKNKPPHVKSAESYTIGSHSVETIPTPPAKEVSK